MRGANTRGVRNHNPGNIERSADPWQGLAEAQGDQRFFTFQEARWGIRAIARILISYRDRHGLSTVAGIIGRWAPPHENNTRAYVAAVAKRLGVDPDAQIDVTDYATAKALVEAIIAHENAGYRYPEGVVEAGLRLAGIEPPAPRVADTGTARAAAGVAVAGAGAPLVIEAARAAAPFAATVERLAQNSPYVIAALVLAVAAWFIFQRAARARREGL